ncbi:MAG TPA: hypothetical protein VMV50_02490 [Candidatus Paceibacterota bacterium]|nr:hypothetical protein [Candidatus Paceibacterota bacterium]
MSLKTYAIAMVAVAAAIGIIAGLVIVGTRTVVAPAGTTATSTGAGGFAPYDSGVRGTVSLGPMCPVERIPPDPACAPKPYATTVTAYRAGSMQAFATGASDASGAFTISLPPGSYTLEAAGGKPLPRCAPVTVEVGPMGYATADISCDTGIR